MKIIETVDIRESTLAEENRFYKRFSRHTVHLSLSLDIDDAEKKTTTATADVEGGTELMSMLSTPLFE